MARKTAIQTDNATERKIEARADARKDRPTPNTGAGLLPSLADWRAKRGQMTERDLLKLAKSAARLELRGAMYSADDRLDVAAEIVARVLAETGGAAPRSESPRVGLGRLCGDAKNLRRSIDATRERDRIETEARAAEFAQSAAAIGAEPTPAAHVAVLQRSGAKLAERAASAVCAELGIPADVDSAPWAVFYVWARGLSPEQCAAERGATWGAWRVRMTRGAKFIRGFYGAAELIAKLTLGASVAEDGSVVYVVADDSREAHSHTPALAVEPRTRPVSDAPVSERTMSPSEKVHWRRRRANRADHLDQTAAALRKLATAHARQARTRERAATAASALQTAADGRRAA